MQESKMEELVKDFLKQRRFAVAGSFRSESKYAYKILKTLMQKGYEVYPVNPRLRYVERLKCYRRISDIPVVVDVVDIVTPPPVTATIVRECKQMGIRRIWLQPGSEDEAIIRFCRDNGMDVIYNLCLILESI